MRQQLMTNGRDATCRVTSEVDAAVELMEEGLSLKVGNYVRQQQATLDLLSMHDSHSATLCQLDEVRSL